MANRRLMLRRPREWAAFPKLMKRIGVMPVLWKAERHALEYTRQTMAQVNNQAEKAKLAGILLPPSKSDMEG